jgi:hypothetical protein
MNQETLFSIFENANTIISLQLQSTNIDEIYYSNEELIIIQTSLEFNENSDNDKTSLINFSYTFHIMTIDSLYMTAILSSSIIETLSYKVIYHQIQ